MKTFLAGCAVAIYYWFWMWIEMQLEEVFIRWLG